MYTPTTRAHIRPIQRAEQKRAAAMGFTDFVESQAAQGGMLATRIWPSLHSVMIRYALESVDDEALRLWAATMLLRGTKTTTATRYLGAMRRLWQQWGQADADPFADIIKETAALSPTPVAEMQQRLTVLPALIKKAAANPADATLAALLALLYQPDMSIGQLAEMRIDALPDTLTRQAEEVLQRLPRSPQSRYALPLGQGRKRPGQIVRQLTAAMHSQLRLLGLEFGTAFSRLDITAIWTAAALAAQIDPRELRRALPAVPPGYEGLSLLAANGPGVGADGPYYTMADVAASLDDHLPRWHVMHLRQGITPDDLRDTLAAQAPGLLDGLTLYYPTYEHVHREGHRLVSEQVPFLPSLLFFRCRPCNIQPLMRTLGHQAWCYRTTASPTAPYATIPAAQMALFQRHIGAFTADIRAALAHDTPPPAVGDLVTIGAPSPLAGYQGRILATTTAPDGTTHYTLTLTATTALHWHTLTLPSHLLTPTP